MNSTNNNHKTSYNSGSLNGSVSRIESSGLLRPNSSSAYESSVKPMGHNLLQPPRLVSTSDNPPSNINSNTQNDMPNTQNNENATAIGSVNNRPGYSIPTVDLNGLTAFIDGCSSGIRNGFNNVFSGIGGSFMGMTLRSSQLIQGFHSFANGIHNVTSQHGLSTLLFNPSYDKQNDDYSMFENFLITGSNYTSVEYYSQDPFEKLKFKVTIRPVRTSIQIKTKTRPHGEEDEITSSSELDNEEKECSFVFGWQQKVFSPRELVKYYLTTDPETVREQQYRREVKRLAEEFEGVTNNFAQLSPYAQVNKQLSDFITYQQSKKNDQEKAKEKIKRRESEKTEEQSNTEHSSEEPKEENPQSKEIAQRNTVWGANGFKDLLAHRLSTMTDSDDIEAEDILTPITCSAHSNYQIDSGQQLHDHHPSSFRLRRNAERPRTMRIMANFGRVVTSQIDNRIDDWEGIEYALCIIKVMPDGSFVMKPGLSIVPSPSDNVLLESDILKKAKRQEDLIKKMNEKKYVFRAKNGQLYEYSINLFNEHHRDLEIDNQRKEVVQKMNERTLMMRRNLVGQEFQDPPRNGTTRIHLLGEIVSATNFESNIYVRYVADIPEGYMMEEPDGEQQLWSHSQTSIPSRDERGENFYSFNFPFEFHMNAASVYPAPKIYFEVMSTDFWNRRRVEGYGYLNVPSTPGDYSFEVSTWKPSGSIRDNLRSYFIGGSAELSDISYTAVPKHLKDTFLNKFGYVTESGGSIQIKMRVITQSVHPRKLWQFHDFEASPEIVEKTMDLAMTLQSEEPQNESVHELYPEQANSNFMVDYSSRLSIRRPSEHLNDLIDEEDIQQDVPTIPSKTVTEEHQPVEERVHKTTTSQVRSRRRRLKTGD